MRDAFAESSDDSEIDTIDSMVMKDLAVRVGIGEKDIIIETASTHTYENLKKAMSLIQGNNFKTSLLVSSGTHMYRVVRVAKKLGMDFIPAHAPNYNNYRVVTIDRIILFMRLHGNLWDWVSTGLKDGYKNNI